ncbi:HlyU family transcriptional regulator [Pseudochrobactrum sp. sp1633]|uniref:HlyU family transcriptional regulator n=1 Tax=Pseudochrobactrum sp. sp1633 TaxID=3036706 RepID=UPI0025A5D126|nr:HlyU family transcriptional regulator [Pseudochrobactrum sp. sp1633]MDM8345489.1 HlyU family transcriptional regulator [Pseudochrobactrum sp. sp1633]HWD13117.1 HlyU family transcriptional regulator [Pseudochrobactrum sp.]
MSFLKRLFGLGSSDAAGSKAQAEPVSSEHKGFVILATPFPEAGQFQTCGLIRKEIDGEMKEHKFIRADRFATMDDAVNITLIKARQIIDEQGEGLFR